MQFDAMQESAAAADAGSENRWLRKAVTRKIGGSENSASPPTKILGATRLARDGNHSPAPVPNKEGPLGQA